jgi:hypothetical protein
MMVERSQEMIEEPIRDTFFGLKGASQRPVSVTTEFMESDWEMDDDLPEVRSGLRGHLSEVRLELEGDLSEVHSEFEEDGEPSPRGSFHSANSVSKRSVAFLPHAR